MRLWLVRHGSTKGNARHAYVGRSSDEALSEEGRAQAAAVGFLPQVKRVYVSPLLRARQTAELCLPDAVQLVVAGLEEMDFGAFEGKSAADLQDDADYRQWVDGWCTGRCPGGEDREAFVARTVSALEHVLASAREAGEQDVVVLAHGGTVMAALSVLASDLSQEDGYFEWQLGCCEAYACDLLWEGARSRVARMSRFPSTNL